LQKVSEVKLKRYESMNDDRSVQNPNVSPFNSVVAVDARFADPRHIGAFESFNGVGSGIAISPSHALTAGHIVVSPNTALPTQNARVLLSTDVATLSTSRVIYTTDANGNLISLATPSPQPINVNTQPFFPLNYPANTGDSSTDIALLNTQAPITTAQNVLGLVVFLDPANDIVGAPITTGGYPGTFSDGTQDSRTDDNTARTLYSTSGTVHSVIGNGTRIEYSDTVDTQSGQSGSGVWYDGDLFGESVELIAAIHTRGFDNVFRTDVNQRNSGVLISKEIYDSVIGQIEGDSGAIDANELPENTIVGSDFTDDDIFGSYRKERIIGQGGNDRLLGGGADDRLEGGNGVDQALFSDLFTNYDFEITDATNPAFEFEHVRGSVADGTDTTQDVEFGVFEFIDADGDGNDDDNASFFVPLQVDPSNDTKLKDGPTITPDANILDSQGSVIGSVTVESPAWTFDGDVDFSLTIGSNQGTLFNFAYIIDSSGSVAGEPFQQAKDAYTSLTNSLISRGVANNSLFAVIPFGTNASLLGPLTPSDTISTVQGLPLLGFTNFDAALAQANLFFSGLPSSGATNIAYFLSDGSPNTGGDFTANAVALQSVADVRAFGIGSADLETLNIVDSGTAELLTDPSDLDDALTAAPLDRNIIERIDVKLAGNVIDTISPSQLTEDTLGLSFEGTIDGLEVTRTAENNVTFDVVFNDGTPTTSLDYTITTGQEQVAQQTSNGTREVIIFSVNQSDFTATLGTNQSLSREINGNDLDNVITVEDGENTLLGNGGNDRFILLGGTNLVDGGDGVDTVVLNVTQAEAGEISQIGEVINIGSDTTLLNTEFIEFSDVRLTTDSLTVTPVLSLMETNLSVTEGDSGSATFTVNLSSVTAEDVVIDFATQPKAAEAGTDFVAATGQLTIAAGESSGEIVVEVLDDTDVEGEESVRLNLTAVSGATFADGTVNETADLSILDNDSAIGLRLAGLPVITEGSPDTQSTVLPILLERSGSTSESSVVEVQIVAAGSNPAQVSDFTNGFSSTQVTFAPGERTQTVEIPIAPDTEVEDDETFGVRLIRLSGSATVLEEDTLFTILDDDEGSTGPNVLTGTPGQDNLSGTVGDDSITGFQGRDIIATGAGNDLIIYTSVVDAGDVITDFTVGSDKINISQVLESLNYTGSDPIADGYLKFTSQGNDTFIQIDPDGFNTAAARSFILARDTTVAELNNLSNFVV
jgi:V8-like Glu-specific endopeptidase/uncharacterized protein YegL